MVPLCPFFLLFLPVTRVRRSRKGKRAGGTIRSLPYADVQRYSPHALARTPQRQTVARERSEYGHLRRGQVVVPHRTLARRLLGDSSHAFPGNVLVCRARTRPSGDTDTEF